MYKVPLQKKKKVSVCYGKHLKEGGKKPKQTKGKKNPNQNNHQNQSKPQQTKSTKQKLPPIWEAVVFGKFARLW